MLQNRRQALANIATALSAFGAAGCGYTVGPAFSPEIRSVHVPIFENLTNRRGIENQLTEAVQTQIKMRTPFVLANAGQADTILKGKIVSYSKTPLGETGFDDVRELQLNLQVQVTFEDARTREILATQNIPVPSDFVTLSAQGDFAPEVGQSKATAEHLALQKMARQIVDMMEQPW